MNEEQLKAITGLFAGVQAAVVHLCNVLDAKGVATKEELAGSFEATADLTPDTLMSIPLRQIADGIRSSNNPEGEKALQALLARLRPPAPPANG